MTETMPSLHKHCGRLGKHLGHYWRGAKIWEDKWVNGAGRWVKPTYWCKGQLRIEGGHK